MFLEPRDLARTGNPYVQQRKTHIAEENEHRRISECSLVLRKYTSRESE